MFGLEHQQVGHISKRQAEADHLRLRHVVGELTYVDDLGRRIAFDLLTVPAIGYEDREDRESAGQEPGQAYCVDRVQFSSAASRGQQNTPVCSKDLLLR